MSDNIINISRAGNVHIETPELSDKLDQIIESMPDLIESTIAKALMRLVSDGLDSETVFYNEGNALSTPIVPFSLKSKKESAYASGDIVLSHWEIVKCIGKGSFSTVYEAHHVDDSAFRSAIKIIHSSLLSYPITASIDASHQTINASYMIQQELHHMIALKGTGYIVDYEDHETVTYDDGSWDIIIRMELLQSLPDVLNSTVLPRDEVIRLGIDICKALEFCNKYNIVHRDVKPANIYLTKWGGYKLGDFGASTRIGDHQEADQIGTLKYMAPEVYNSKPFTLSIDIYSLGLVLYEIMNRGNGAGKINLSQRFSGAPLPKIPGIDNDFQAVILKACSFRPEDRFSSPTEMHDALVKLLL